MVQQIRLKIKSNLHQIISTSTPIYQPRPYVLSQLLTLSQHFEGTRFYWLDKSGLLFPEKEIAMCEEIPGYVPLPTGQIIGREIYWYYIYGDDCVLNRTSRTAQ